MLLGTLLLLAACTPGEPVQPPPTWGDVRSGLSDLRLQPLELGQVAHFEVTRGLSEDLRLLKVRAARRELSALLAPFQISAKALTACERKAFPSWSKSPTWQLEGQGPYRCGGAEWTVPGDAAPWLVLAFVSRANDGGELVHLALYRGR